MSSCEELFSILNLTSFFTRVTTHLNNTCRPPMMRVDYMPTPNKARYMYVH